jgi:two-component system CheB/CheR fusion protein
MQALNEELMTVNMQFRAKTDELTELNNDMANLLNSAEVATLFLSNQLYIKRFTPSVTEIIPLVPTDVGRPIANLVTHLRYEHLVRDVQDVLDKLTPKEVEVEATGGQWYLLRIIPYRTLDNFIGGAVLSFQAITALKAVQAQLQTARGLAGDLLDALPEPAVLLDGALGVVDANGALLKTFGLEAGQVRDRAFYKLGNGAWDAAALRGWLEAVLAGNAPESFPAAVPGSLTGSQPVQLKARRLRNREGEGPQLLVTLAKATA